MTCGVSLVMLWNYLQGKKTRDGAEICVTSADPAWDGSWSAPGNEVPDDTYFDLKKNGAVLCMDGEECECVFDSEKNAYVCLNSESDMPFLLTAEEFGICTFN